jgi:hypothetical protein
MKYFVTLCLFVLSRMCVYGQVIVTVAGTGVNGYSGDGGPATNCKMTFPLDLTFDRLGNLYFTDDAVSCVRRISADGLISRYAGTGISGYGGDGGLATDANITGGGFLATDKWNNVYLSDGGNHRIRKITFGGLITTVAGTGTAGYNGDGIPATNAQLNGAQGIAVDEFGNIYVCDRRNYRIRKIDTAGIIHTVTGNGVSGISIDGSIADTAAIDETWCIKVDVTGNVLFNENDRIRRINVLDNTLETLAGNGVHGYAGDGGLATTAEIFVENFTVDSIGNIYITGANRIRKVDTGGIINTIAGTGAGGFEGDGVNVSVAKIPLPGGLSFSDRGELNYAEKGSARIRKITMAWDGVSEMSGANSKLELYPNPAHGVVNARMNAPAKEVNLTIMDASGVVVKSMTVPCNVTNEIDVNVLRPGVYTLKMTAGSDEVSQQLIVK